MQVQVKYQDYVGEHTMYVVQGKGPTLLGRDWLQHVQLDWWSLRVVHVSRRAGTLSEVLSRHDEMFADKLGCMSQFTAKLVVCPGATQHLSGTVSAFHSQGRH